MKKKLPQGANIWNFLNALVEHIIIPAGIEVAQLRNGLAPKRGPKKTTIKIALGIKCAEKKLTEGTFTTMQFLRSVSYLYANMKMTPGEKDMYLNHLDEIASVEEQMQINIQESERINLAQDGIQMESVCKVKIIMLEIDRIYVTTQLKFIKKNLKE